MMLTGFNTHIILLFKIVFMFYNMDLEIQF